MKNLWITMSLDQDRDAHWRGFYIAPSGSIFHMDNKEDEELPDGIVRKKKGEYEYKGIPLINV